MGWRLVYNNEKIVDLFEVRGNTYTPHNIYNGVDQEDCFIKVEELGYYYEYPTGSTQTIIFSGGGRTISTIDT
tara:strand:+ start:249 stop:467 length:219 start_codon:yes stop_codon:yes gene_type:complete